MYGNSGKFGDSGKSLADVHAQFLLCPMGLFSIVIFDQCRKKDGVNYKGLGR